MLEESYRIFPGKDVSLLAKNKENSFICDVAIFFKDVAVHPQLLSFEQHVVRLFVEYKHGAIKKIDDVEDGVFGLKSLLLQQEEDLVFFGNNIV
jgi:hypothetical protein